MKTGSPSCVTNAMHYRSSGLQNRTNINYSKTNCPKNETTNNFDYDVTFQFIIGAAAGESQYQD